MLKRVVPLGAFVIAAIVTWLLGWSPCDMWQSFIEKPEPWVAGGTIVLALATFVLAAITKQSTNSSLQEVAISRLALQTSTKPLLIEAARGVDLHVGEEGFPVDRAAPEISGSAYVSDDGEITGYVELRVPVENVGAGLALIEHTALLGLFDGIDLVHASTQSAVRPDQRVTFSFSGDTDPGDASVYGDDRLTRYRFYVDVWYTDLSGGQRTRTRLMIEGRKRSLRATRVFAYDGDSTAPFIDSKREVLTIRPGRPLPDADPAL
jgi:hypothetical protein